MCYASGMNLGLDLYGTITKNPPKFAKLAQTVIDGGGKVYIITAIAPQNVKQALKDARKSHVPHTDVVTLTYGEYFEVPPLKVAACKEYEIDIMVDDRIDTIKACYANGILGLLA